MSAPLMSAAEVAELLGVPTSWIYEQSRHGRIPTVTLGRYRRYRREAIEGWVEELEAGSNGERARVAHPSPRQLEEIGPVWAHGHRAAAGCAAAKVATAICRDR